MRRHGVLVRVPVAIALLVATAIPGSVLGQDGASPDTGSPTSPAASLATPEDAVRAYVAGVSAADLDAVLAASAVDQASAGFDLAAYVERLRMFDPLNAQGPAEYPFYVDINRAQLSARLAMQVRMLAYSLLSDQRFEGPPVIPADPQWADAFIAAVDPARLAGLTVEDVRQPVPELANSQRNLDNMAKAAKMYGADEQVDRLALLGFEGRLYDLGFTLLRYGDTWGVISQVSPLAGTDSFGNARPTTQEAYDAATGG
jgi:hypothetical protein